MWIPGLNRSEGWDIHDVYLRVLRWKGERESPWWHLAPFHVGPSSQGQGSQSLGTSLLVSLWVGLSLRKQPTFDIWIWNSILMTRHYPDLGSASGCLNQICHAVREVLFVLIAIIRYFKLSSKQIVSILRQFLSSSSHLIVKLDWNRIPPWKSEDFLRVTDPTCSDMLSRCYKAFYVSLIL